MKMLLLVLRNLRLFCQMCKFSYYFYKTTIQFDEKKTNLIIIILF